MKLPIGVIFSLFLFAAFVRADDYAIKEPFTRSNAFNPTAEVTLENVNGNVDVRVWDKNEILIEGEKSAKTQEELEQIDLKIELSEKNAAIKVRLPKRSGGFFGQGNIRAAVRFTLTVPATVTLAKISSVNSSVSITGVRGSVDASSVNGAVNANGLSGSARLATVNGGIKARFASLVAEQRLSFKTVNGGVVVTLPKDAGFQLHSSTVNGGVECAFPLENGRQKHGKNLSGKIGDGRADLEAETVNGSVRIVSE